MVSVWYKVSITTLELYYRRCQGRVRCSGQHNSTGVNYDCKKCIRLATGCLLCANSIASHKQVGLIIKSFIYKTINKIGKCFSLLIIWIKNIPHGKSI